MDSEDQHLLERSPSSSPSDAHEEVPTNANIERKGGVHFSFTDEEEDHQEAGLRIQIGKNIF